MEKNKKIIIAAVVAIIIIALIVFLINKNTKELTEVFTVSYAVDGQIVNSEQVDATGTATKPKNPSKEGYEFLGWYLGDEEYDFSKPVIENITLEAKWKKLEEQAKIYKITVNIDGTKTIIETDEKGMMEEPKTPTKAGYKFLGWYIGNEKVDFSKPMTGDVEIEAKWEKEVIETSKKPTTKPTTPSKPETPETPTEPTTPSEPEIPTEPTTPSEPETPTEPETPETPVVTKYTVKFEVDGTVINAQEIEKGKTATLPTEPKKEGYKFLGWYVGDTKFDISTTISANMTLTAKWEKITPPEPETPPVAKKYTVKFKVDGETVSTQEVEEGKKITTLPTTPTKAGYTFKGWYCDGNAVTVDTVVSKEMTVEAKWDSYTFELGLLNGDAYSPNRTCVAYKNGIAIAITGIYGNYNGKSEYTLGKANSADGKVIILNFEQFKLANNYKVQLSDGTRVFANMK